MKRWILVLLLVPASCMAQSVLMKLVNQATKNLQHPTSSRPTPGSGGEGVKGTLFDGGSLWRRPAFVPPTIDGYTHIRLGSSALDAYNGDGLMGVVTCDPQYIGAAILHEQLDPRTEEYCEGVERQIDPGAPQDAVAKRIAFLGATRKYYFRGHLMDLIEGPANVVPPGKVVVEISGTAGSGIVLSPMDAGFKIVGPRWSQGAVTTYGGWPHYGGAVLYMYDSAVYKLVIDLDPAKIKPTQITSRSTVFFTVGDPIPDGVNAMHVHLYRVPIRIDRIIFDNDPFTSEYREADGT